jgi:hypothetical protein
MNELLENIKFHWKGLLIFAGMLLLLFLGSASEHHSYMDNCIESGYTKPQCEMRYQEVQMHTRQYRIGAGADIAR